MLPSDRPNASPSSSDPFGKASFPETSRINGLKYYGTMASTQNAYRPHILIRAKIPFKKRLLLVGFEAVDYTLSSPSVVSGGSWVFDISTKTQAVSISIRISQGFYDHQ